MEIIEGGQPSNAELLERIVRDRVKADGRYRPMSGLGIVMHGNVVEVMEDQAHLAVDARIPLQVSCRLCETGMIVATFPSPRIVPPSMRNPFLELANAVNLACVGVGGLVLDDLDLAFMTGMPYELFQRSPMRPGESSSRGAWTCSTASRRQSWASPWAAGRRKRPSATSTSSIRTAMCTRMIGSSVEPIAMPVSRAFI